jgi:hypothetical protein
MAEIVEIFPQIVELIPPLTARYLHQRTQIHAQIEKSGDSGDVSFKSAIGLWKTPTNSVNTCWEVSVTTMDGSSITAYFKLT